MNSGLAAVVTLDADERETWKGLKHYIAVSVKPSLYSGYCTKACHERQNLSPKETSQRWRAVGYSVSDLTDPVIKSEVYRTIACAEQLCKLTGVVSAWI